MSLHSRLLLARLPAVQALLLCLSLCACSDRPGERVYSGQTMGTQYLVKLVDNGRLPADAELAERIEGRLERVNRLMSTYRVDSEVSRFNQFSSADWFDLSAETRDVLVQALAISERSAGAFDITLAPLIELWGFGASGQILSEPPAERIESLLQASGYQRLALRLSPPALRKDTDALEIDLSAIAKGYAVDAVAAELESLNIGSFLIEVGGEIRVAGRRRDGRAWQIAIEQPLDHQRAIQRILELSDISLATSGDYRNFFIANGQRYSHTLDPRTGYPVKHQLAAVTVLAEDCMLADGWATAFMVLGPEKGYALAQQLGLAALFIVREGDTFSERASDAFHSYL